MNMGELSKYAIFTGPHSIDTVIKGAYPKIAPAVFKRKKCPVTGKAGRIIGIMEILFELSC